MIRRPILQPECDRFKRLREMGHSITACAAILKRQERLLRNVEGRGYTPTPLKQYPRPADFSAMAAKLTLRELGRHYGVRWKVLKRWSDEVSRKPRPIGRPKPDFQRPCPPDFVEMNAKLTWANLLKHYRAGASTIDRWRQECGVTSPRKPAKPNRPPKPANDQCWIDRYQPTPAYLKLREQLKAADSRSAAL